MSTHRLCLTGASAFAAVIAFSVVGCSSAPDVDRPDPGGPEAENIGVSQEAVCGTSSVDGSAFPQGDGTQQCVHGVIVFYQNKFGVTPPAASGGPIGNCAHYGACNIWVNPANQPNPAVWNRYAWGAATPQAYDMVVFPPTASNAYGHIASVDHDAAGKLWQMDSNWSPWKGIKAACVHDVGSYAPYGFYRLKSLEGAAPPASTSCHKIAGELTFMRDGTDVPTPLGSTSGGLPAAGDPEGDAPAAASGCSASSSSSTRNAGAAIALVVLIGTILLTRRGRLGRRL